MNCVVTVIYVCHIFRFLFKTAFPPFSPRSRDHCLRPARIARGERAHVEASGSIFVCAAAPDIRLQLNSHNIYYLYFYFSFPSLSLSLSLSLYIG